MVAPEPTILEYDHGIRAIDTQLTGVPMLAASHLLVDDGEAALVDVGSNYSVPVLMAALARQGIAPSQVRYVCVTHVHLDHAGGAGELMRRLPEATLIVHPRGARHMIDPSALYKGSLQVFGAAVMEQHYGELVPVPEERVCVVDEGDELKLGRRTLRFLDTPGHANHHYSIVDDTAEVVFSGDTFGISYRWLDSSRGAFVFPAATPVDFNPEAAHRSIERLMELRPRGMHLAHFGRVTDLRRLADELHTDLCEYVSIAERHSDAGDQQSGLIGRDLRRHLMNRLINHGVDLSAEQVERRLGMDMNMNTEGLVVWLRRRTQ